LWRPGEEGQRLPWQGRATPVGREAVGELAFLPDGNAFTVGGASGSVQFWDWPSCHLSASHFASQFLRPVTHQAASARIAGVISHSGRHREVHGWWKIDLPHLSSLWEHEAAVSRLAISPGGHWVASAAIDATVIIGEPPRGKRRITWRHDKTTNALLFASDDLLLTGTGGSLFALDVPSGKQRWAIHRAHANRITALALSPDGQILLSASEDRTVAVWNVEARHLTFRFDFLTWKQAHRCLAVAPDGLTAAVAGRNGTVALFDLDV
jgi:WD40 repeat protein